MIARFTFALHHQSFTARVRVVSTYGVSLEERKYLKLFSQHSGGREKILSKDVSRGNCTGIAFGVEHFLPAGRGSSQTRSSSRSPKAAPKFTRKAPSHAGIVIDLITMVVWNWADANCYPFGNKSILPPSSFTLIESHTSTTKLDITHPSTSEIGANQFLQ